MQDFIASSAFQPLSAFAAKDAQRFASSCLLSDSFLEHVACKFAAWRFDSGKSGDRESPNCFAGAAP